MSYDLDDYDLTEELRNADRRALDDISREDFTCNKCHASGSGRWMITHDCARNQELNETGGRCEDYPCCGHTDGDGCRTLESHTGDYWHDILAARDAMDDYDYMDDRD